MGCHKTETCLCERNWAAAFSQFRSGSSRHGWDSALNRGSGVVVNPRKRGFFDVLAGRVTATTETWTPGTDAPATQRPPAAAISSSRVAAAACL